MKTRLAAPGAGAHGSIEPDPIGEAVEREGASVMRGCVLKPFGFKAASQRLWELRGPEQGGSAPAAVASGPERAKQQVHAGPYALGEALRGLGVEAPAAQLGHEEAAQHADDHLGGRLRA